MKRRVHSREFKLEVARQVTSGEKRPAQVCREYNLSNSVLDRWRLFAGKFRARQRTGQLCCQPRIGAIFGYYDPFPMHHLSPPLR